MVMYSIDSGTRQCLLLLFFFSFSTVSSFILSPSREWPNHKVLQKKQFETTIIGLQHRDKDKDIYRLRMGVSEELLGRGMLVAYEKKGGRAYGFGVIHEKDGKKNWQIKNEKGNAASISPKQMLHILKTSEPLKATELSKTVTAAEKQTDETLLELAWETLLPQDLDNVSEIGAVTPEEVCNLIFGDSQPESCIATCQLLLSVEGRTYFHQRKSAKMGLTFEPKVPGVVESLKQAAEAEKKKKAAQEQKEQAEAERQKRLIQLIEEGLKQNSKFDKEALTELDKKDIADLMLMASKSNGKEPAGPEEVAGKRVMSSLGRVESRMNAWKLCLQLELFEQHENLWLYDSIYSQDFSKEILGAIESFVNNPPEDPDASIRKDLTYLKVYTIDSSDTFEVDDGLSVETCEDGTEKIWIHIADASRWVQKGDILDEHASQRTTTVYLPDKVIPMFPSQVASRMSLLPGAESYAMSCCVLLNEDGSIRSVEEVVPSTLQVTYKITYEDVEDMRYAGLTNNEEKELGRLLHWADIRRKYRALRGSLDANNPKPPESKVVAVKNEEALDGWEVKAEAQDINAASYLMVTEMMILAGEAVAKFAADNKIVVPFRSQRRPEDLPDDDYFEKLPLQYCRAQAFFKFMKPAEVSLHPEPHAGLSLDQYLQWTSPIRRYSDLLVHYQLKSFLHGKEGMTDLDVSSEIFTLEGTLKYAGSIMGKTKRYWLYEFMRRNIGELFDYYVLSVWDTREYGGRLTYTLLLPQIGARIPYHMKEMILDLGQSGKLQIIDANPRVNILSAKLIRSE